ncbi:VOC family protein [Actinoplanes sp. NPDC000266]
MHTIQLGMVVLDVRDLQQSVAFYRLLGLDIPGPLPGRPVTIHRMESGVALVLTEGYAEANDPTWRRPDHGYQHFMEFFAGDDASVDAIWNKLTEAGHHGRMAPRRTTGPYAAMVDDPDGNVLLISSDPAARPSS